MDSTLTDAQQKLSDFMSDISEKAYTARWMSNLEYVLWEAILNGPGKYGHYFINQTDIDSLVKLSEECITGFISMMTHGKQQSLCLSGAKNIILVFFSPAI